MNDETPDVYLSQARIFCNKRRPKMNDETQSWLNAVTECVSDLLTVYELIGDIPAEPKQQKHMMLKIIFAATMNAAMEGMHFNREELNEIIRESFEEALKTGERMRENRRIGTV